MGQEQETAEEGLAQPDPQERCLARALTGTRKHRSACSPAFRGAPIKTRTGGAAEARGTSCEIKGFTEQDVPLAFAVPTAPVPVAHANPAPGRRTKKKAPVGAFFLGMAERVGFEPTVGSHQRLISSQVHSTTLPPLRTPVQRSHHRGREL